MRSAIRLPSPTRSRPGILGLAVALALASGGCFLDEIDKAANWQGRAAEQTDTPAPSSAPTAEAERPNWWASAKSLGSEESKSDIVQCKVGKTTQFTGREDCLARGGRVE